MKEVIRPEVHVYKVLKYLCSGGGGRLAGSNAAQSQSGIKSGSPFCAGPVGMLDRQTILPRDDLRENVEKKEEKGKVKGKQRSGE
jgi:hypothetical protein